MSNPIQDQPKKKPVSRKIFGSFLLSGLELALPVSSVQEVVNYPETVNPVPLSPKFLVGIFNLRGLIIPIINVSDLLELGGAEPTLASKIAVVFHGGIRVGLVFDETSEIIHASDEQIANFEQSQNEESGVVSGALKLNGSEKIIQILDPSFLVGLKNIPRLMQQLNITAAIADKRKNPERRQCISFKSGDSGYAVEISSMSEIIFLPSLEPTAIGNAHTVGMTSIRGIFIPVIDFSSYLGSPDRTKHSELDGEDTRRVLILTHKGNNLGLLVQSVESIVSYKAEELQPAAVLSTKSSESFGGLLLQKDAADLVLLNSTGLFSEPELRDISEAFTKVYNGGDSSLRKAARKIARSVYINFRAGGLFSVSIKEMSEIIPCPDGITVSPGSPSHVQGVISLRGQAVTVIDLRKLFHLDRAGPEHERKILVMKKDGLSYGFVVDSVEDIASIEDGDKVAIPGVTLSQSVIKEFATHFFHKPVGSGGERQAMIINFQRVFTYLESRSA